MRIMRTQVGLAVLLGATIAFLSNVYGAEYFVNKQGNDANNGQARETAFLTIKKGFSVIKAGDTLTVGPGEYFESISREGLGSPDVDTVIRAEIPGTALMHGDVAVNGFQKVEGTKYVYSAPFDRAPFSVLEHDTLKLMEKRPNIQEVEYDPGTFCYDAAQKKLYISTSTLRAPGNRRYTAVVDKSHRIELKNPQKVIIDGMALGRCYPGWGMVLHGPSSCVVRNCKIFLGEGGIDIEPDGGNNLIENCESYAHLFAGVAIYWADNSTVRNCRLYRSSRETDEHFGFMHYRSTKGPLLLENNISWGQQFDFSVKPAGKDLLKNCVALGGVRNGHIIHSIIGGSNEYDRDNTKTPADSILFLREKDMSQDFEFADPLNLDFHLQADSRFRGAAPDGSDSGPYPYEPNIFYLSSNGDDQADGLSMRKPWRTFARAISGLRPGDTLYIAEGEYAAAPLNNAGDNTAKINIRGRGHDTVVIKGKMDITGDTGVVFERVNFADGASLTDSRGMEFKDCKFYGAADGLNTTGIDGLKVTHTIFDGVALEMAKSTGAFLSGNLYANNGKSAVIVDSAAAVLYSDYNSYQDQTKCWTSNGASLDFAALQKTNDQYSQIMTPEFTTQNGAPVLANVDDFNGRGLGSSAVGTYREFQTDALHLDGPILHSVTDTTANLEWFTSNPATFELAWGETPEMTNRMTGFRAPHRYTTYSLTDLKPDTTYYFKILSADCTGRIPNGGLVVPPVKPEGAPLSFKTASADYKASTYYVAPNGNDANDGLSRANAWRTVTHAADTAKAGDTVFVAGGEYIGTVRVRATGDKGKPLTFTCVPGEKVTFNGTNLVEGFKVIGKRFVNIDGFYFTSFAKSMSAVFYLWRADDVKITRCFNVAGTGNNSFLNAKRSSNLLVQNCVGSQGFSIMQLVNCPNSHIEHNVFVRPWIISFNQVNNPDDPGYFTKNIVTDNQPSKKTIQTMVVGRIESFMDEDNCYFLRFPDEQRKMFQIYGTAAFLGYKNYGIYLDPNKPQVIADHPDGTANNPRMSLKDYQDITGRNTSYVGDPKFASTPKFGEGFDIVNKLAGNRNIDFPDLFATDPKAVEMGVGLQPDAFKDFWFNKNK